jgi:uncharacterized protein (DUF1697 family)
MLIHLALVRGVNLAGHKPVNMADLRNFLTELGFIGARSLLQSGNLVFRNDGPTATELERLLEVEAAKRLELHTDFFVRTAEEWNKIIAQNPFRHEAESDPKHLQVMFLKNNCTAKEFDALQAAIKGPEIVRGAGREAYIVYPIGIGKSRLTNALIEKKLVTRSTGRNWNTVLKLADLAGK